MTLPNGQTSPDCESYDRSARALELIAAVGDPMQPFAAGLALSASRNSRVALAGGSQMLAVYSLARQIAMGLDKSTVQDLLDNTMVVTTKWVTFDPSARTQELAKILGTPLACPMLNLLSSRHQGLKAYEEGNVKEGVGAGCAIALAHLSTGTPQEALVAQIDSSYLEMVPFSETD